MGNGALPLCGMILSSFLSRSPRGGVYSPFQVGEARAGRPITHPLGEQGGGSNRT